MECGQRLLEAESGVQWWIGDWWAYGEHVYGERVKALGEGGPLEGLNFQTARQYGWVARAVPTSSRRDVLSFQHHMEIASLPPREQQRWLSRAEKGENGKPLSANQLRAAIRQQTALDRTAAVELKAKGLGKFVVLYADPPWRYENPPMGGSNRSIENHYPTMDLNEICALPVADLAHENSVLFMWATSPKLSECMEVLKAWGFSYRTKIVWVKDKIGMGYHVREQHESLLIAKRGELAPPAVEARPASVLEAPRLGHSAKPDAYYDIIDKMYPDVRKIELFARDSDERDKRPCWTSWGNHKKASDGKVGAP